MSENERWMLGWLVMLTILVLLMFFTGTTREASHELHNEQATQIARLDDRLDELATPTPRVLGGTK